MIKVTNWSPDTCHPIDSNAKGCEIQFTWDNELPVELRVHRWHATVVACSNHGGLEGPDHLDVLWEESRRKNLVQGLAAEALPEKLSKTLIFTFMYWKFVMPEVDPDIPWKYERLLEVSWPITTLTTEDKALIQAATDIRFGSGKVRVA